MKKGILGGIIGIVVVVLIFVIFGHAGRSRSRSLSKPGASEEIKESFMEMCARAASLHKGGELVRARDLYRKVLETYAFRPGMEDIQKKVEALNMKILFSGIKTPETTMYKVVAGDSLYKIAKKFNTTVAFIKKQNGLRSDVIKPDTTLRIWTGRFSVSVDKSQNILTLKSDGKVLKNYVVSTGKDSITPVGSFKIVNKLTNPAWHHDGEVIPPTSKKNILGTRWLGFDEDGYGIHGTTQPESIGRQVTAGCVRMLNRDVEQLYDLLPVGTAVRVIE